MSSVSRRPRHVKPVVWRMSWLVPVCLLTVCGSLALAADQDRPTLPIADATAKTESEMKPYAENIEHTDVTIDLVPIPGGEYTMGSPDDEEGREDYEGPQHKVKIEPFWMSKCEMKWDAFDIWTYDLDIQSRQNDKKEPNDRDKAADEYQLSQPTAPYTDMTFGMGKRGYPAICMTQFAARIYCEWLTAKTGRYYRLPTEAEWEYACRAGSKTAYSFGNDPDDLDDYAWYFDNSDEAYQKVGQKKPNAWGLHDMHGNVAEWVLDQFSEDYYSKWDGKTAVSPLDIPEKQFPRVVRGGSWDDDPEMLRSAARAFSDPDWQMQDPQIPKSIWYHTDALRVGFRIIRPLTEPTKEERKAKWDAFKPEIDRKMGR